MKIDRLIRTRRKTVAIIVDEQGQLLVRAPRRLPRTQIQELVDQHADRIAEQQALRRPKRFVDGELFWYLGVQYPLSIVDRDSRPELYLADRFYLAQEAQPRGRELFQAWYRAQAKILLPARVDFYAGRMSLRYRKLRITSAQTRWGSCSSKGDLNFTWRLLMVPPESVDYVVVHELAHLQVQNHSPEFWALVERTMPDYRPRQAWMKERGKELVV